MKIAIMLVMTTLLPAQQVKPPNKGCYVCELIPISRCDKRGLNCKVVREYHCYTRYELCKHPK